VLATLEATFGLRPLTARDGQARDVLPLLANPTPRLDPLRASGELGTSVPGFLHVALLRDLGVSDVADHPRRIEQFSSIRTRAQAGRYARDVLGRIRTAESARRR
jgi:hypothetical protein